MTAAVVAPKGSEGPDEPLLALIGAALARFGPSLTLWYHTDRGARGARCKIIFPQPDQTSQGSQP